MKLHRYFVNDTTLSKNLTIDDTNLVRQWTKVLRYVPGRELSLYNADKKEAHYKITEISKKVVKLEKSQDVAAVLPSREIYLCFALLKKDKNEWILQKATELGVSHFVPLLTDRTEKSGWNQERAQKIVIEAAEQCGRADIPTIHIPQSIKSVIKNLPNDIDLYVAEQSASDINHQISDIENPIGIFIGPEGGWSENEKALFIEKNVKHISLSQFTLRAETAAITAVALCMREGSIRQ